MNMAVKITNKDVIQIRLFIEREIAIAFVERSKQLPITIHKAAVQKKSFHSQSSKLLVDFTNRVHQSILEDINVKLILNLYGELC